MSAPRITAPADVWAGAADELTASGVPWPEGMRLIDLRYLANRWWLDRVSGAPKSRWFNWPSERELAARWNVSRRQARRSWQAKDEWVDPVPPWSTYEGAPWVDQKCTEGGPETDQPDKEETDESDKSGPGADQERTKNVATRGEDKTTNNQQPTTITTDSPGPPQPVGLPPAAAAIPPPVLAAVEQYRAACGFTRKLTLDPKKGEGKHVAAIVQASPGHAATLFAWLAKSGHERAVFYRERQIGAESIRRKLDALLDLMDSHPPARAASRARNAPPGGGFALVSRTPEPEPEGEWHVGMVWATRMAILCREGRSDRDVGPAFPDNPDAARRAHAAVGGMAAWCEALGDRDPCTIEGDDLDQLAEAFRQAFDRALEQREAAVA